MSIVDSEFFANSAGSRLQCFHQVTVLFGAASVESSVKDRDHFENILCKLMLEPWSLAFVDDDDLDSLKLALLEI